MKYDVFISYSRKDSVIVKQYCEFIKKAGLSLWIDEDGIETGDEFKRIIVRAISDSNVFLFFSSADSNVSPWTIKEVNVAVHLKKKIIPIKLDDSIYEESLLFDLAGLDYLEHYLNDPERNHKKLLSALGIKDIASISQTMKSECFSQDNSIAVLKKSVTAKDNHNETEYSVGDVKFTMINVLGGHFSMGSNAGKENEKPVHRVTIEDYMCGETAVTQELWQAVMGNNPARFKSGKNPVESVSWEDSQEFLKKLNEKVTPRPPKLFRLLTEAEWEFAARGGRKSLGYKYAGGDILNSVGWYRDNNPKDESHEVKGKLHNELGIYDMSGGVWEWCQDWYNDKYSSNPEENPIGPRVGDFKVVRGGSSWFDKTGCTVSYRRDCKPDDTYFSVGLRLAL